jgi:NAD(P)-dependent dehydrogenase (short-subunit alcohol dehydrogenase family)
MPKTAIIVSISSDIGLAMAYRWLARGDRVLGTYRTDSPALGALRAQGAHLVQCDLGDPVSVVAAVKALSAAVGFWDVLVVAPGTTVPIGPFIDTDFDQWDRSIAINFTNQMRLTHGLLRTRSRRAELGPCVLFFAGGGTNNATVNYSAYTVSKIALIKMCELLDAEIPDSRFAIVGPGWVKTKIHTETLRAGSAAGSNLQRTREKIDQGDFTPMDRVLDCCDWVIEAPREIVSGRNFSVVFDAWDDQSLAAILRSDPNMYKLRRAGNDRDVAPRTVSKTLRR